MCEIEKYLLHIKKKIAVQKPWFLLEQRLKY